MRDRALTTPLDDSFERYLQSKGEGRGGGNGNYRRNAVREIKRFAEWATDDRDDGWTGIADNDIKQPEEISHLA